MNKKGFTLVELLATIVILGLIVTIVYPVVISTINSSRQKARDSQIKIIEKGAKMYYLENPNELKDLDSVAEECKTTSENDPSGEETPENDPSGEETNAVKAVDNPIPLSTLISEGYITGDEENENELIDPCTEKPIQGDIEVKWICDKNQYEYKFVIKPEFENACGN
ncbi:MAG: prepilin-type N-terminal cleavage/methylation domain-containing protein [Bacilli bacterium]|nr:prepilin-type N-terminal cleavage/methylation domain-containing protein [Bacilli bacterium]